VKRGREERNVERINQPVTEWTEYKTKDLCLVTEIDQDGKRGYQATEIDTFTFTLE
jgi:hypothetical protein